MFLGYGALIGAVIGYLIDKYRGQEITMMKLKKDLEIGAFAGTTGFFLIFIFWYLTTGYFDWQFPAIIGIGCFGGGFLGSMLRRLYKTGEDIQKGVKYG